MLFLHLVILNLAPVRRYLAIVALRDFGFLFCRLFRRRFFLRRVTNFYNLKFELFCEVWVTGNLKYQIVLLLIWALSFEEALNLETELMLDTKGFEGLFESIFIHFDLISIVRVSSFKHFFIELVNHVIVEFNHDLLPRHPNA